MKKATIIERLNERKDRSAWDKAVTIYAIEILEKLEDVAEIPEDFKEREKLLLNGANNWSSYSYGGCSLIYNFDIAERVCTPSELKARRGGEWNPNKRENWIDVQARALSQAARRISATITRERGNYEK